MRLALGCKRLAGKRCVKLVSREVTRTGSDGEINSPLHTGQSEDWPLQVLRVQTLAERAVSTNFSMALAKPSSSLVEVT
jgi:hypothetical protein